MSASVYAWPASPDSTTPSVITTSQLVANDDATMNWVDTYAWDQHGNLWYTANHLDIVFTTTPREAGAITIFKTSGLKGSYQWSPTCDKKSDHKVSASCSVDTPSNASLLPLPEGLNYLPDRAAFVVGNLVGDPNMGLSLFGMGGTLEKWVQPEGMVHTFGIQHSFDKTSLLVVNATLYGVRF